MEEFGPLERLALIGLALLLDGHTEWAVAFFVVLLNDYEESLN